MEYASYSKLFRNKESELLNKLVLTGSRNVARIIGVHESQITRWQRPQKIAELSFIEKMARFLVAIEYDSPDTNVVINREDAKALIEALEYIRYPKRKTSKAGTNEASEMQLEMSI
ncbi:CII family transcriptional regulator [Xenorhabdus hominickii]|uniref:Transcriptional regulator n=1 Tax=Xenorhabdus hominickii TaxID=351679 RepID=A0A2G0QBD3_XENHO|nr:CII family transcriptional regulator [Xenorhabdus hominickii]AOM40524.1 transcriptional regulator [Xenorhabdus hominickii]PHM56532.1 transcriptional regulator [Xenorhabdus hominickii]